jgi:hypothetical protein
LIYTFFVCSAEDIERSSGGNNNNPNLLPSLGSGGGNNLRINNGPEVKTALFEKNRPMAHKLEVEDTVFNHYQSNEKNNNKNSSEANAGNNRNKAPRPASAVPDRITVTFHPSNNNTSNKQQQQQISVEKKFANLTMTTDLNSSNSRSNRPVSAPTILPQAKNQAVTNNSNSPANIALNYSPNTTSKNSTNSINNNNDNNSRNEYQQQSHPHHQQQYSSQAGGTSNKGSHPNKSGGPDVVQFLTQNKNVTEAVYTAPYLKAPPKPQYTDTTQIPNRHYHNATYHLNAKKEADQFFLNNNNTNNNNPNNNPNNNNMQTNSTGSFNQQQQQQTTRETTTARPSSSKNPGASRGLSAVDRALSIGKNSQQILQERDQLFSNTGGNQMNSSGNYNQQNQRTRNARLNEMLEGNIIEKLDHALGSKR